MDNNHFLEEVKRSETLCRIRAERRQKSRRAVLQLAVMLVCATVVLTAAAFAVFRNGWQEDENAKPLDELTVEEGLQEQLQRQADEAMFTIQIYAKPSFENGTAEGLLYIANASDNHFDLQVSITRDDDGTEVYRTAVLKPGDSIPRAALTQALAKGVYPATALFTALDPESGAAVGQTSAGITITILN